MVQSAIDVTEGRLPLVAGVAGVNIEGVTRFAEDAAQAGAKYAMIAPPFYDSIDQDGMYEWYRILNESVDIGIMIYDQYKEADRLHTRLASYMALFQGEFAKGARFFHPAAIIKALLEYVGLYGGPLRPPFRAMNEQEKKGLYTIMDGLGVK